MCINCWVSPAKAHDSEILHQKALKMKYAIMDLLALMHGLRHDAKQVEQNAIESINDYEKSL